MSKQEHIKLWFSKADEDLLVVRKLTEYEIIASSSVCFHCQQAVEKYLKAFLIFHNIEIKRTHNIEFLLEECKSVDMDFDHIDPKNLSDFGVSIRYPGEQIILTEEETIEYKHLAEEIEKLVKFKINEIK